MSGTHTAGQATAGESRSTYTLLEQALWKQFRSASSNEEWASHWLALQCHLIGDALNAVLVLGEPEVGPFAPAAVWPPESSVAAETVKAAESAMAERRGVALHNGGTTATSISLAYPILLREQLFGVVAITVGDAAVDSRRALRQLQWGSGWVEVLIRRTQYDDDLEQRQQTEAAFDLIASALEPAGAQDACNSVVTELAQKLDCDPVSVGFISRSGCRVYAISHSAEFGKRMNLVRSIADAMDEAVDQEVIVHYPVQEGWEYRVTRAHQWLAEQQNCSAVLTIPLRAAGSPCGALVLQKSEGTFSEADITLCDGVASVLGPILLEKRNNDRSVLFKIYESLRLQLVRLFGPHYLGRKLASVILLGLVVLFSFLEGEYRVTAPARVEGQVQRVIVAPLEGYLFTQHARAGEEVTSGQLLATLDDRDLVLERLRWSTTLHQRQSEFDRALGNRERAEANIIQAQIDQAAAQIALLDEQLARTRIVAPFDGVLVSGDLTQSIGAAMERGQELFTLAPLNEYRVILEVDETDIESVSVGQTGLLRLSSAPENELEYQVERLTPLAEQADGRNFFAVEASLSAADSHVRPGMKGVGKTLVGDRLLIRIWTEKMVDWIRLNLWKWIP
ncbi:HlyD family efflux transporter periplasmic adaptor subunit [Marinobacterium mangrovicola]|uniref:GAF domain-containing protein n=1 Tax=Marinobacterium mangrovicola TaxID=1476959 RepID=A0A4R1GMR2_9GAMM|nr:HlyD family efflux transporter periplasmic adaptor subunit [Marinobacterium mangrovicola]TCK07579.1 GAF domain-containing protein [Marinobacterium mangrovicola]